MTRAVPETGSEASDRDGPDAGSGPSSRPHPRTGGPALAQKTLPSGAGLAGEGCSDKAGGHGS
ncbi:hypothetical protein GCM10022379_29690 [Micromonospora maritima]